MIFSHNLIRESSNEMNSEKKDKTITLQPGVKYLPKREKPSSDCSCITLMEDTPWIVWTGKGGNIVRYHKYSEKIGQTETNLQ